MDDAGARHSHSDKDCSIPKARRLIDSSGGSRSLAMVTCFFASSFRLFTVFTARTIERGGGEGAKRGRWREKEA